MTRIVLELNMQHRLPLSFGASCLLRTGVMGVCLHIGLQLCFVHLHFCLFFFNLNLLNLNKTEASSEDFFPGLCFPFL